MYLREGQPELIKYDLENSEITQMEEAIDEYKYHIKQVNEFYEHYKEKDMPEKEFGLLTMLFCYCVYYNQNQIHNILVWIYGEGGFRETQAREKCLVAHQGFKDMCSVFKGAYKDAEPVSKLFDFEWNDYGVKLVKIQRKMGF